MDRAAKLAAEARECLRREAAAREATRAVLASYAEELGYSTELEISSAIDQALKDAGTTP